MPQFGVVGIKIAPVIEHRASGSRPHAGKRAEQSRLAGAAWPDHTQQASLAKPEGDVVQQHFAAWQLHGEPAGVERDVAGVEELLHLVTDEPEGGHADADDIGLGHHGLGDPLPVHERAVLAAEVGYVVLASRPAKLGVVPRHSQVRHHHVIVVGAAYMQDLGRQRQDSAWVSFACSRPLAGPGRRTRRYRRDARICGGCDRTGDDRARLWVAEADLTGIRDVDTLYSLAVGERPVGAAGILEQPVAVRNLQNGVPPGDQWLVDRNVRRRVPANPVGGSRLQRPAGTLCSYHKRRGGVKGKRVLGCHLLTLFVLRARFMACPQQVIRPG